ncbi:MAG: PriCT-2 domain-containing protein [Saprospiraceae bacterium]|nr:PriCT-2 domain-containing protein [Saprospiraceae bacterium]
MSYIYKILEQGGSVVPITVGKTSIVGWDKYSDKPATIEQAQEWVKTGYKGFGVFPGIGDIRAIDLDTKNLPGGHKEELIGMYIDGIDPTLKPRLTLQRSISGGMHVFCKCSVPTKKEVLSKNPLTNKPVCEIIGSHNYIVTGADGYSVASGSFSDIQEISSEQHAYLKNYSKQFFDNAMRESHPEIAQKIIGMEKPETELDLSYREVDKGSNVYLSKVAATLREQKIDITGDYNSWTKICYSIVNERGEGGRSQFHEISCQHPEYSFDSTNKLYDDVLKSVAKDGNGEKATIGTINYHLKQNDVQIKNDSTNNVAIRTRTTISFLQAKGLKRNLFTNKVELTNGQPLNDSDIDTYYTELREGGQAVSKTDVTAIINSDKIPKVDPILDFMVAAQERVKGNEIDILLDSLKLKTKDPFEITFYRSLVRMWLLQIPAMIYERKLPRLVLVLIGDSYIGKTEFFRRLFPLEISRYYAESALDREKDSEMLMSETLMVNIDELAGILQHKKYLEKFKSFASAKEFTLRAPYGQTNEKYTRKAILCGTSNRSDVINDDTAANSRLIPIELEGIDHDLFNGLDKTLLLGALAQEYQRLGSDCTSLTQEDRMKLNEFSAAYAPSNIEEHLVQMYVRESTDFMHIEEIYEALSNFTRQIINKNRLSRQLYLQGFIKMKKRVDGNKAPVNGFQISVKRGGESVGMENVSLLREKYQGIFR